MKNTTSIHSTQQAVTQDHQHSTKVYHENYEKARGIIELYYVPNTDHHWKRELVGAYTSMEECMAKTGFTRKEITAGLTDELIREHYILEFSSSFMHNLALDYILEHNDNLTQEEIAGLLGINPADPKKYLQRVLKKLNNSGSLRDFLHNVRDLREAKARRAHIQIVETTTTISILDS